MSAFNDALAKVKVPPVRIVLLGGTLAFGITMGSWYRGCTWEAPPTVLYQSADAGAD